MGVVVPGPRWHQHGVGERLACGMSVAFQDGMLGAILFSALPNDTVGVPALDRWSGLRKSKRPGERQGD